MAHGNPIGQALEVLRYDNVYVDSAFMPIENIRRIIEAGYADRLLWGTDMCIPMYYEQNVNPQTMYMEKLDGLRRNCSDTDFENVTANNAKKNVC